MWKKIVVCCFVDLLGKALVLLFYFGREGAGWQGLLCSMKFIALLALSIAKSALCGQRTYWYISGQIWPFSLQLFAVLTVP